MVLALIVMLCIGAVGVAMVTSTNINATMAKNYRNKIQSFYAADGQMTLLAQEVLDSNEMKYMIDSLENHGNVGSSTDPVATSGQYFVNNHTHTVVGGGSDVWSKPVGSGGPTGDHCHFAYDSIAGDADITVRVVTQTNPNNSAKAGIMIRSSKDTLAAYAYIFASATHGVIFELRPTSGVSLGLSTAGPSTGAPIFLRLQKIGSIFNAFSSTNGSLWTPVGTPTSATMPDSCLAGLAVTAHTTSNTCTATFDSLTGLASTGKGTSPNGIFAVDWSLSQTSSNCFNISTKASSTVAKWGTVFQTPLNQYLERKGGGLVNPYGDTALLPVTFYNFHSNRTNPEFEQPNRNGLNLKMVCDSLDTLRKPMVRLPQEGGYPHRNYYIAKWFRPWAAGDSTIPVYQFTTLQLLTKHHQSGAAQLTRWLIPSPNLPWGWCDCIKDTVGQATVTGETRSGGVNDSAHTIDTVLNNVDTAFKNIVIQDTLPFIRDTISTYPGGTNNVPNGTYHYCALGAGWQSYIPTTSNVYQFVNTYNSTTTYNVNGQGFFPLDNKGFGVTDWFEFITSSSPSTNTPHNYSFTMEMHRSFIMVDSLFFQFTGDDDLWVFINNYLVLDLGGPHTLLTAAIRLDSINAYYNLNFPDRVLQKLQTYNFDLFYTQRHAPGSDIEVMTNLMQYSPTTTKQRSWKRDYGSVE
jgi:fibro-slime domain-containing protein